MPASDIFNFILWLAWSDSQNEVEDVGSNGFCAARVMRFNDIFTSFYARQWYDVTRA